VKQLKPYPSKRTTKLARHLRREATPAEQKLWQHLRNRNLFGLKFRRQQPIGHFIVDFYCHEHKLIIEVDGGIHERKQRYDEARTRWLEQQDCRVIRFKNEDVIFNVEAVLNKIARLCGKVD